MAGTSDRVAERLIARYYYKLNCIHRPSCVSQIYRLHAIYLIQCHLYSRLNWQPFIFSTSLTCIISPWQRPHNKPLNPPVLVQLPVLGVSTWIGESTCISASTCIGWIYLDWWIYLYWVYLPGLAPGAEQRSRSGLPSCIHSCWRGCEFRLGESRRPPSHCKAPTAPAIQTQYTLPSTPIITSYYCCCSAQNLIPILLSHW